MKRIRPEKQKRYVFLILVLIANLIILSANSPSLPWYSHSHLISTGLFITTPLLILLVLTCTRTSLMCKRNQLKLAISLIALLLNVFNLVLASSDLKTTISLLITTALIIKTFSISYPITMSY